MRAWTTILLVGLLVFGWSGGLVGAANADSTDLQQIKRQIQKIKADEERERRRDEKLIEQLEGKVDRLESQNEQFEKSNQAIQTTSLKLQAQTSEQLQQVQQRADVASSSEFAQQFHDYLGEHTFTLAGGAAGSFIYPMPRPEPPDESLVIQAFGP